MLFFQNLFFLLIFFINFQYLQLSNELAIVKLICYLHFLLSLIAASNHYYSFASWSAHVYLLKLIIFCWMINSKQISKFLFIFFQLSLDTTLAASFYTNK